MDRVAQLAKIADDCIGLERICFLTVGGEPARALTRHTLEHEARSLGFPENEISSAIDTALGGR